MTSEADPIARAQAAAKRIEQARAVMGKEIAAAAADRRAAVLEARATMSAQEVADALGISRARVYAIAAGRD